MEQFILDLLMQNPKLGAVLSLVGVARVVFKPLMTLIQTWVDETANKKDDEWFKKLLESKYYKALVWVMDYLLSVKMPKK